MVTQKDKRNIVYAFIDSQNLNLGIQSLGWKLDFRKFRIFLKDKFRVSKAFLFIGYIPSNEVMYKMLKRFGYKLVFKPTLKPKNTTIKGNVDAELVLHSAKIQYGNYQKGIFVSGDGDFYCLYKELQKDKKLGGIIIPNFKCQSILLAEFEKDKYFLQRLRVRLEYK